MNKFKIFNVEYTEIMNEIWRIIEEFPSYAISNIGNIKRIKQDSFNRKLKELKKCKSTNGYLKIQLWADRKNKWKHIHRLVLETFNPIENMNNLQVNHINGIKSDNRLENLEWCTPSENGKHAFRIGLSTQMGSKNSNSKLLENDIIIIKKILKNNEKNITLKELGCLFNVSPQTICDIKKERNWSHIKI